MTALQGLDISKVLSSEGPIVKAVLLRVTSPKGTEDEQKPAVVEPGKKLIREKLIEEVEIDTTPRKSMVAKILGGPFTFLGQYEDEGTVLMIRKTEGMDPLELPPFNVHTLQPPFDETEVRGDILVMKVAPTKEELDDEDGAQVEKIEVPTNDEFFLDYTKEEYVAFASRTDVVAPTHEEEDDDEEEYVEGEEDGDEDDEEYQLEDDESRIALLNMMMGQLLRKFQEENGRGATSEEVLELRAALSEKIGITLPQVSMEDEESTKTSSAIVKKSSKPGEPKSILGTKRDVGVEGGAPPSKKVKFDKGAIQKSDIGPPTDESKENMVGNSIST